MTTMEMGRAARVAKKAPLFWPEKLNQFRRKRMAQGGGVLLLGLLLLAAAVYTYWVFDFGVVPVFLLGGGAWCIDIGWRLFIRGYAMGYGWKGFHKTFPRYPLADVSDAHLRAVAAQLEADAVYVDRIPVRRRPGSQPNSREPVQKRQARMVNDLLALRTELMDYIISEAECGVAPRRVLRHVVDYRAENHLLDLQNILDERYFPFDQVFGKD